MTERDSSSTLTLIDNSNSQITPQVLQNTAFPHKFAFLLPEQKANAPLSLMAVFGNMFKPSTNVIAWTGPQDKKYVFLHSWHELEIYKQQLAIRGSWRLDETIFAEQHQRPKFDIDGGDIDLYCEFEAELAQVFEDTYGIKPDMVVLDSTGITKFSRHIIISNCSFSCAAQAAYFANHVLKPACEALVAQGDMTQGVIEHVDWGINKDIQNFRMVGATNDRRTLRIISNHQAIDSYITYTKDIILLPNIDIPPQEKVEYAGDVSDDQVKQIADIIEDWQPETWDIANRQRYASVIIFNRLRPSHCDQCDPDQPTKLHESLDMFVRIYPNCARRFCFRDRSIKENDVRKSVVILKFNNPLDEPLPAISDTILTHVFYSFYDVAKYYEGSKRKMSEVDDIFTALRQVLRIRDSGASCMVVLMIDKGTFEVQKWAGFIANIGYIKLFIGGFAMSFADIVLRYRSRLTCKKIVFAPMQNNPEYANLFIGYTAQCLPEITSDDLSIIAPLLDHIKTIWARNDDGLYDYIIDWFANIIQKGRKNKTALVLYSRSEGAGKNVITDFFRQYVIGTAYTTECNNIDTLTAKFNSSFTNRILTMINETHSDGSAVNYHRVFDIMKDLITNERIKVEYKGIDSFDVDDYNNYIITTNNYHPVRVSPSNRRYTFIELDNARIGDTAYFDALWAITTGENAQRNANIFLTYLMTRKITHEVGHIYPTPWGNILMESSARIDPVDQFVADVRYEHDNIAVDIIYTDYVAYCTKHTIKPITQEQMICKLRGIGYITSIIRKNVRIDGKQCHYYVAQIAAEYIETPPVEIDTTPTNQMSN
jgi:hypothetical protein